MALYRQRWIARLLLKGGLLVACLVIAAVNPSVAGQMGDWTIKAKGKAVAQTWPEFRPVAGDLLRLSSDADSTTRAECETGEISIPYRISWWIYVVNARYDDLVIYHARDEDGEPTDVSVMFREHPDKMPLSPDDWHGMVWIEDAEGCRSVSHVLRPGWHHFEIVRKSQEAVEFAIDGNAIGTYSARSEKPAAGLIVGDLSSTDGSGEAYWGAVIVSVGEGQTAREIAIAKWMLTATGAGLAEQGIGLEKVRFSHLFLRSHPGSGAEAEWGTVRVEVPYQFWCQVYISDDPYQSFSVICPLDADGQPTDFEILFDDADAASASEVPEEGFVWVVDAEGRHNVGSITRGVWHQMTIRRRTRSAVALLIDDVPLGTFISRSEKPVVSFRFGDFSAQQSAGEAYWYRIRLVQVPKH